MPNQEIEHGASESTLMEVVYQEISDLAEESLGFDDIDDDFEGWIEYIH